MKIQLTAFTAFAAFTLTVCSMADVEVMRTWPAVKRMLPPVPEKPVLAPGSIMVVESR